MGYVMVRGESFFAPPFGGRDAFGTSDMHVERTDDGAYRAELPVPGFGPSDVEITLDNRTLTISGKAGSREFSRSLLLPRDIDGDAIAATVEHGLLVLALPRHAKALPKKIDVTQNGEAASA